MAGWCLIPSKVDEFKKAIVEGHLDPDKLASMSSKERRDFFAEKFGDEDAEQLNRQLESKLLLKDQQRGMVNWAQRIIAPKEVKRDLISRIERMDRVLDAKDEKAFLEDLAAHRLGTRVTYDEAAKIMELSNKVQELEPQKGNDDYDKRMEYGRSVVELNNYISDLKRDAQKITGADVKQRPVSTVLRGAAAIPGIQKSLAASLDASAILRQGWKTLWSHPGVWAKNSIKSLEVLAKTFGGKEMMDEVNADIMSRPTYSDMQKAHLDVGTTEEAFPTSLPEKVPGLRRPFKASEAAYTAFTHKTRADLFDKYLDIAKKNDVELSDLDKANVARMVNSLVGRGYLGRAGRAGDAVNVLLFSPRSVKSHIDTVMQPFTGGATLSEIAKGENSGSDFVRKEAAKNLVKTIGGTAAVLALASAVAPGSVDWDPRSSDFGKIRWRGTRFDVTGGMGNLAVLASRILTRQMKSTSTGAVSSLTHPKFGQPTLADIIENFFESKASPAAGILRDFAKGRDFQGNTMDASDPKAYGRAIANSFTPLPVSNAKELLTDPNAAPALAGILADALGVGTNTYNTPASIRNDIKKAQERGDRAEVARLTKILPIVEQKDKKQKQQMAKAAKGQ